MIVLDASLVVELLTIGKSADSIKLYLATSSDNSWIVPHLLDIEVLTLDSKLSKGHRAQVKVFTE